MSLRRVSADVCLAGSLTSAAVTVWLVVSSPDAALDGEPMIALSGLAYVVVGALIARRRPENRLSWVLIAIGVLAATGSCAQAIVDVAVHDDGAAAAPLILAHWYAEWFWVAWLYLQFGLLPLLFPTGQPLSDRWRPVVGLAVAVTVGLSAMAMLQQDLPLGDDPRIAVVDNPIGLLPIRDLDELIAIVVIPLAVLILLAVLSLLIRLRRADGVERRQLAVVMFAVVLVSLGFFAQSVLAEFTDERSSVFDVFILSLVPASIGVAVLRYRLYDIDRIVSRTVSYALVSLVLAGIYVGTVLVLGTAIRGVSGQDSAVVVAGSTLAAVAAFQPVSVRVKRSVDRRFNRPRYDAQRAVERFGAQLRSQIDPNEVAVDVISVADRVLRPAHISLWTPGGQDRL